MVGKRQGQGMTERAYAAHSGLSRSGVQKARRSGRLVTHADGSIDAAASDNRRAETTDPSKQRGDRMRAVPEAAIGVVADALGIPTQSAAGSTTFLQARAANEVLKAQERKVRLQRLKGELVDRERAAELFFALSRQARDSLLGLPVRVAATMAANLGVDAHAVQTELDKIISQHLKEMTEVKVEFR